MAYLFVVGKERPEHEEWFVSHFGRGAFGVSAVQWYTNFEMVYAEEFQGTFLGFRKLSPSFDRPSFTLAMEIAKVNNLLLEVQADPENEENLRFRLKPGSEDKFLTLLRELGISSHRPQRQVIGAHSYYFEEDEETPSAKNYFVGGGPDYPVFPPGVIPFSNHT